jgi:hypothetical protein
MKALLPTTLLALMLTVAAGFSKKGPVDATAEVPAAASRQAAPESGKAYEVAPETVQVRDELHTA